MPDPRKAKILGSLGKKNQKVEKKTIVTLWFSTFKTNEKVEKVEKKTMATLCFSTFRGFCKNHKKTKFYQWLPYSFSTF